MNKRIADLIVRSRWVILVAFFIAIVAASLMVSQFKIDASADTLLVKDNKLYIQTQIANQTFSPEEFILLAYAPQSHALYSDQTFRDLHDLSAELKQLERVKAVTSILTVPLIKDKSALSGETDVASLTWEAQHYSPNVMQSMISGHPIFTDLLVNRDNTATAIQIVFKANPELVNIEQQITDIRKHLLTRDLTEEEQQQLSELQAKADPIRQALSKQRKQEIKQIERITQQVSKRANTYLGGSYVVGQHLVDIIQSDLQTFGLAILAVIAVLLLVLYRTLRWVIFPLVACAISVLLTIGLFGALDLRATVISANFIALQIILTLAVMIHLIGSYREIARTQPELTQKQRVIATLQDKLTPCFYATLTTSVGFSSLIFSGLQPVVSFGWMMLFAMLITMSVGLLLFPALLCLLKAKNETNEITFIQSILSVCNRLSSHYPKSVVVLVSGLFVVTSLGISKLNVENSFIDYFAKDTKVHQELAFIDQQFGGTTALDIILHIDEGNEKQDLTLSADTVNQLHLVQAAVKAFDATGSVTSIVNFTELAKQLNDDMPLTEYELTTIFHLLDKQVVNQLVGAYYATDARDLRIAIRIQDTTEGLDRQQFMNQLTSDLATVGLTPQEYELTSLFVLYQDILSRLFDSQITTLGIVYVALGLVMFAIFRSFSIGLIALIPNVLTTLGILGLIGWLGMPLDIMTITIAAIAMGIAVDDTIHFVHAYLSAYRKNNHDDATRAAAKNAFGHTGLALVITTTVITVGFSLFGFSDFIPSVSFGLLTATAMLMALITDLTLLPALLNWRLKRNA